MKSFECFSSFHGLLIRCSASPCISTFTLSNPSEKPLFPQMFAPPLHTSIRRSSTFCLPSFALLPSPVRDLPRSRAPHINNKLPPSADFSTLSFARHRRRSYRPVFVIGRPLLIPLPSSPNRSNHISWRARARDLNRPYVRKQTSDSRSGAGGI